MVDRTEGMTSAQALAVTSDASHLLIYAGAGAGKTKVIVNRILRLLDERTDPRDILAVTFTNKAADEMRERLLASGVHRLNLPLVSTFHGFCVRVIRSLPDLVGRTEEFRILDQIDADDFLSRAAQQVGIKAKRGKLVSVRESNQVVEEYERYLRMADAVDFDLIERLALQVLETPEGEAMWRGRYAHVLIDEYQDTNPRQHGIALRLDVTEREAGDVVDARDGMGGGKRVADEAGDATNTAALRFAGVLSSSNIVVVGDPRQAIYAFRGANRDLILGLMRDPAWQCVNLAENFRSVPAVVRLANVICDQDEPMVATRGEGGRAELDMVEGATQEELLVDEVGKAITRGVAPKDIAVLGRTWRALGPAKGALERAGIPVTFHLAAEDAWGTATARLAAAAAQLTVAKFSDDLAYRLYAVELAMGGGVVIDRQIVTVPMLRDRAQDEQVGALACLAQHDRDFNFWRTLAAADARKQLAIDVMREVVVALECPLEEWREIADSRLLLGVDCEEFITRWAFRSVGDSAPKDANGVQLMTVHAAKGLEWPVVFVLDVREGVYPSYRSTSEEQVEEDRRILYVAATRARDALHLLSPSTWTGFDGVERRSRPSRFLRIATDETEQAADAGVAVGTEPWRVRSIVQGAMLANIPDYHRPAEEPDDASFP
jgi:DNA helicase II / ATP-dependent DNA helicase PcrA